jgi:hypothetical protein
MARNPLANRLANSFTADARFFDTLANSASAKYWMFPEPEV